MAVVAYNIYLYYNFEHWSFPAGWELVLLESLEPAALVVAEIRLCFLLSDRVALE